VPINSSVSAKAFSFSSFLRVLYDLRGLNDFSELAMADGKKEQSCPSHGPQQVISPDGLTACSLASASGF